MFLILARKNSMIFFIAVLIVVSVMILNNLQRKVHSIKEPYFINWTRSDAISCHYLTEGDSLTAAEEIVPPPDSIFFHETSCRGGLNSRQACAVESVARIHPERNVYVFFNSPVSEEVLTRTCLSKLVEFKNIKLARLHTVAYSKGTALGAMLANKEINRSHFKIEHTADILRFITMFKYGGVYLDTDVLVVKPLDPLGKNWSAREDDGIVNVAVMAIGTDKLGHGLVAEVLESIKSDYRPDAWSYNGPGALTRVLLKFCNTSSIAALSADICHGFQVYDPKIIFPVHYSHNVMYFTAGELPMDVSEAYTHHLWNRLSRDLKVEVGSPYDKLASKHCPTIRTMFGDQFGS